jgi:NAD+ kinase
VGSNLFNLNHPTVKIGLFGKQLHENFKPALQLLVSSMISNRIRFWVHPQLQNYFAAHCSGVEMMDQWLLRSGTMPEDIDFMIAIGGDGTFLEAFASFNLQKIPLLGINTGRLGFLTDISPEEIAHAVQSLISGNYRIEERSVLAVSLNPRTEISLPYALNELTVHKRDTSSMIMVHAYIDGVFLTRYWADGLIVATPTGSTAYSMSVGGPIVTPDSQNLIISPIASHNLTVRPVIIPDHCEVMLKIESRDSKFLLSLDSRSYVFEKTLEVRVKRSEKNVALVKLSNQSFYDTLRNKLMWGIDKRN